MDFKVCFVVFWICCAPFIVLAQREDVAQINQRISKEYSMLDGLPTEGITDVMQDKMGFIWLATYSGLCKYDGNKFTTYTNNPLSSNSLRNNFLWNVFEDRKGRFWIGNVEGFDVFGRLWLRTSIGMICDDRQNTTAREFNESDGVLHFKHYQVGLLYQTSGGRILTIDNGITLFDPTSLQIDEKRISPILTKLEVNNKVARVRKNTTNATDDFNLKADVSMLDELTLDYKHNNFTIEFSAMEMTAPEKNLYRHKLEGYDVDWIETDFRNRTATYTNLDAGEYTFRVKASNHHGVWSDAETTLNIKVLPPPWKSTWAYIGYGIIFIALLYAARRNIVQRERLKSNLKLAKVEQEKEHFELEKAIEVDKVKSTFFANISHEFRTPLTLIKGPVQNLLEQFADQPNVKEQLKLVERNSDLLLKLINQLLDLAKLESGNLTVEKSENDLNSFLTAVINSFSSLAFQKNIALEMELPSQRNLARFDKDKVEAILINLINNAIKFTPAGGTVKVIAELNTSDMNDNSAELVLSVSDTGIGIHTRSTN